MGKAHGQNIQRSLEALLRICPWSELAFLSRASAWAADLFERVGICSKTPSGPRLDVCWVATAPMAAPKSGSARAYGSHDPNYHPRACNATIWGARRAESSIRSQADSDSRHLSQTHPNPSICRRTISPREITPIDVCALEPGIGRGMVSSFPIGACPFPIRSPLEAHVGTLTDGLIILDRNFLRGVRPPDVQRAGGAVALPARLFAQS